MQCMAGEKPVVDVLAVDRFDDVGLARPEPHVVAVSREHVRQRRPPRSAADDRAARHVVAFLRPKRCSSPRRKRPMFARCVQKTKSAMITLTVKSGARTPSRIAIPIGSTTAAASDASET